jgi:aspartate aminotransferase/aminotransferase
LPFDSRLDNFSPEGTCSVISKAQALEAEGRRIIHFEIGRSGIATYDHNNQSGIEAIQAGPARYTPPSDIPQLLEAIIEI